MPLFMDRHVASPDEPVEAKLMAAAHDADLEIQAKYGVRYITYWADPIRHHAFCLVEAPSREAAVAVHRESHGNLADKIIEVDPASVEAFLGAVYEPAKGEPYTVSGLRTIVVTDVVDSTVMMERLGDREGVALLRAQEDVIREALIRSGGRLVKSLGDGVLASFDSVVRALDCALDSQEKVQKWTADKDPPVRIRIGIAAGEPVESGEDIFGSAVHLAARVCSKADPGSVWAAGTVRELAMGKGYNFEDRGHAELKGFAEPIRLFSVAGRS